MYIYIKKQKGRGKELQLKEVGISYLESPGVGRLAWHELVPMKQRRGRGTFTRFRKQNEAGVEDFRYPLSPDRTTRLAGNG